MTEHSRHICVCVCVYIYMPLPSPIELGGSVVMNLPVMQETQVESLVWEDPLEKEMTVHSSILAWGIPRTEEPGGIQSIGLQKELDMT